MSRIEPSPRWVRGRLGDETVVDSRAVRLFWDEGKMLPVWLFPEDDVRADRIPADAISRHDGLLHVDFDALDEWLEEDEVQIGHPRDPYHRIDVRRTSRHVRISIGGEVVADSRRAHVLFETGLPPRWYLPPEDIRVELVESDHRTVCAYKGRATHFDAAGERAIAWTYREPLHDAVPVQGLVAFYDERVDLDVDGERWERPKTQWSRR